MSKEPFDSPKVTPAKARTPKPGELLFEFIRASDGARMSCEVRNHGETCGWEAQFLEAGQLFLTRGGFATRVAAVQWAHKKQKAIEEDGYL